MLNGKDKQNTICDCIKRQALFYAGVSAKEGFDF